MSSFRRTAALFGLAVLGVLLPASPVAAQATGRVTGIVTDSATGRALSDVQVAVTGGRIGAVTDAAGRFMLVNVPAGTIAIDARRIGFQPTVVRDIALAAGATITVDIKLKAAVLNLEAIVSTGVVDPTSGTRVPFTVGRVEAANLPVPATNALESIQGKMSGVTIVPSGQPGSGTNILLRSPTSINKSNSPLIVVDGVIQSQSFGASSADLEAMDIESIEVVKGAAAASLYGSRAQSGVIQIRTKRGGTGIEGATQFQFRTEYGTNELGGKLNWAQNHHYNVNADGEYTNLAGTTVVPRTARTTRPVYQRFQDVTYRDPVYDQVDRFFNPGNFTKNSFNISQNSSRTNWFFSMVDTREDGVVLQSGRYEQRDMRVNLDHRPSEKLSFSVSGYHSISNRRELYDDTFFDLINQAPDVDLLTPDPDGTRYLFQGDPEGREENPLYVLATEDSRRRRARTQGSVEGRYTPYGWLTVDANVSYDRSDRRNNFFLDQGVKTEGFPLGGIGEISQLSGTTTAVNAAASANALKQFGDFTLRSTFRWLIEREENQVTDAEGTDFAVPGVRSLDNARTRFVSSTFETIEASGFFLTGGADYQGKYIADALFRRDGSSLFGPEERWNSYYRLSGAWRMSEESWWMFPSINEFKLRVSQGTAGGRPSFNDHYETFSFTSAGGVEKQNLGNVALKPELSTETEYGIDAIWRERYSIQLSYAQTRVEDQLIQIPLAGFFGYASQWQNAGTVEGNTLEGTIEAQLYRSSDVSWRMGLVFDRSRNTITRFDRPCFTTQTIAFRCEGVSLGDMYGFRWINSTSKLPAGAQASADQFDVNDEGLLVWVGAGRTFRDGETPTGGWGSTGSIDGRTYQWGMPIAQLDSTGSRALLKIGDGQPKFRWGMNHSVTYKSFDLFALIDVQVGGNAYNQTNQRMYQWARSADVDQAGKEQTLKKPIEYYVALYDATNPTDYFVENNGFVKLREVSLRYRFGGRALGLLRNLGARDASVSLIGRNLLTWTDYKGYDPEVGNTLTRLDSFDYPRYRTFTSSFTINF